MRIPHRDNVSGRILFIPGSVDQIKTPSFHCDTMRSHSDISPKETKVFFAHLKASSTVMAEKSEKALKLSANQGASSFSVRSENTLDNYPDDQHREHKLQKRFQYPWKSQPAAGVAFFKIVIKTPAPFCYAEKQEHKRA